MEKFAEELIEECLNGTSTSNIMFKLEQFIKDLRKKDHMMFNELKDMRKKEEYYDKPFASMNNINRIIYKYQDHYKN